MTEQQKASRAETRRRNKERAAERIRLYEQNREIVKTGECPACGKPLRRNLALTGWWQCSQFGTEGFRADDSVPPCSFQCFTE